MFDKRIYVRVTVSRGGKRFTERYCYDRETLNEVIYEFSGDILVFDRYEKSGLLRSWDKWEEGTLDPEVARDWVPSRKVVHLPKYDETED